MIHLPIDVEQWPEIRELRGVWPKEVDALGVTVRLFVELCRQVSVTRQVGVLTAKSVRSITREMPDKWIEAMVDAGLLVPQGDDYSCPRFAGLHPHLDPSFRSPGMKGALHHRHRSDLKRFNARVTQVSLFLPPEWFAKPDGQAMSTAETQSVMMVIRAFDGALGRSERPETELGYTQTLISDAFGVLTKHPPELIRTIAEAVLDLRENLRSHPAIPATTEQLLPQFDQVVRLPEILAQLKSPPKIQR